MDWIYGHLDALRSIEPLETNTSFTPLHHRDKVADGSWLDGIHCGYLQDFVEMSPSSSCTRCYFSGRLYKKGGSFWVVFLGWLLFWVTFWMKDLARTFLNGPSNLRPKESDFELVNVSLEISRTFCRSFLPG